MKEFTFVAFTYNQEKYIIQHLESIKYQIVNWGDKCKCNFLLSDDASKDNTVVLAEKWISENAGLFKNINFIKHKSNIGIVNNFLSALNNVQTTKFKLLAGDDLYYKNNIFDAVNQAEFVVTPTIMFDDKCNIKSNDWFYYKMFLYKQKTNQNVRKFIFRYLKYNNVLLAPGIFYNKIDEMDEVKKALSKYTMIEDYPLWNYLLKKENLEVKVLNIPVILYRCDVGISMNKNHSKRKEFLEEEKLIEKEIKTDLHYLPKLINPYRYRDKYYSFMSKHIYPKNDYIKNFINAMYDEEKNAKEYLNQITEKANLWTERNFKNAGN